MAKKIVSNEAPTQFLMGFIDSTGKFIFDELFDTLNDYQGECASAQKDGFWGLIDKNGKVVVPFKFELLGQIMSDKVTFREKGLWGLINLKGDIVLAPNFKKIIAVHAHIIVISDTTFSILDHQGRSLLSGLDNIYPMREEVMIASQNGKYGILNDRGAWVLPPSMDAIYDFCEGLAAYEQEGLSGYLDKKGQIAITAEYQAVFDFSEGYARVKKEGKFGYINQKGQIIIPCEWDDVTSSYTNELTDISLFKEGHVIVGKTNDNSQLVYGFYNHTGKLIYPCKLQSAAAFHEGLALIYVDQDSPHFINTQGEIAFETQLYPTDSYSEGKACGFHLDDLGYPKKHGFMDKTGKVVIKPLFNASTNFKSGVAVGKMPNEKFGILNEQGSLIAKDLAIEPKFSQGLCRIRKTNPEWDKYQEGIELGEGFEKSLLKFEAKVHEAFEKDYKLAVKDLTKLLPKLKKVEASYLDVMIYNMNDFETVIYPIKLGAPDVGASESQLKISLKNLAKTYETQALKEPKSRKGVVKIETFYNDMEIKVLEWFSTVWSEAVGKELKMPAFIRGEDGDVYIDSRNNQRLSETQLHQKIAKK